MLQGARWFSTRQAFAPFTEKLIRECVRLSDFAASLWHQDVCHIESNSQTGAFMRRGQNLNFEYYGARRSWFGKIAYGRGRKSVKRAFLWFALVMIVPAYLCVRGTISGKQGLRHHGREWCIHNPRRAGWRTQPHRVARRHEATSQASYRFRRHDERLYSDEVANSCGAATRFKARSYAEREHRKREQQRLSRKQIARYHSTSVFPQGGRHIAGDGRGLCRCLRFALSLSQRTLRALTSSQRG